MTVPPPSAGFGRDLAFAVVVAINAVAALALVVVALA